MKIKKNIEEFLNKVKKRKTKSNFTRSEDEKHNALFSTIYKYFGILMAAALLLVLADAAFIVYFKKEDVTEKLTRNEEDNTTGIEFGTKDSFSWQDSIAEDVKNNKKSIESIQNNINKMSLENIKNYNDIKNIITSTSVATQRKIDDNLQNMRSGIYAYVQKSIDEQKTFFNNTIEDKIKKIKIPKSYTPPFSGNFMPIPKKVVSISSKDGNYSDATILNEESLKQKLDENKTIEKHKILVEKDKDIYRSISIDTVMIDDSGYDVSEKTIADVNNTKPPLKLRQGMTNGVLVTGVSAPTFEHDKNPAVVYLTFKGKSIISNMFEQDVENCTATGSVFGNIVTRRVEILVNKISCTYKEDGKTYMVRANVKGWVYDGNDGRMGIPGILVDSSGGILNDSIIIGMLKGFGGFVSNTAQIYAQQGNAQTLIGGQGPVYSPADVAKTNLVGGVGNQLSSGFDTIIEYYQKIIEALYPYIDIKGGRKITIFFDGGETLQPVEYTPFIINEDRDLANKDNEMEIEVSTDEW